MSVPPDPDADAADLAARYFDLAPGHFCIVSTDGIFVRMSPAWEPLLGTPLKDIEGRHFSHFVHPDDRDRARREFEAVLVGAREVMGFECRLSARDGPERWLRWWAKLDPAGSRILAGALDITLEHERELELAATRAERDDVVRNQTEFFDLTIDLLAVSTLDGHLLEVNAAWSSRFGYDMDELVDANFIDFVHPEDVEPTLVAIAAMLGSGVSVTDFEHRYRRRDGTYRWVTWSSAIDLTTNRIFGVGRDTTERREGELEAKAATQAAEQSSRAKSAFLETMSHELRTPLNSIIGFSAILARNERSSLTPTELEYVERIRANGVQLLHELDALLDLSRSESDAAVIERVSVDIVQLVDEVIASSAGSVPAGVELTRSPGPELRTVLADHRGLEKVLRHLVENACKFTEAGFIELRVLADGGTPTAIEITDSGLGIPEERLEQIFEPFRQADEGTARSHGGTGVGLAIARDLCRRMGYRLSVRSVEGRGSTFSVSFDSHPATRSRGDATCRAPLRAVRSDADEPGPSSSVLGAGPDYEAGSVGGPDVVGPPDLDDVVGFQA